MNSVSEQESTLLFECPLSERTRTWLRLEEQFSRTRTFAARREPIDHRAALLGLFDIIETTGRSDIKTDLLQELDRQHVHWNNQIDNPGVAQEALSEFLRDLEAVSHDLHSQISKIGQHLLRDYDWLQLVRQRAASPGGACAFELPVLHSWLAQPEQERRIELKNWIDPLVPLEEAVLMVLRLLRESSTLSSEIAFQGDYQRAQIHQRSPLLARIEIETTQAVVPEVSANKYSVNLRFLEFRPNHQQAGRPCVSSRDIPFRLGLCTL